MDDLGYNFARKLIKSNNENQEELILNSGFDFFGDEYRKKIAMSILYKLKIIDIFVMVFAYLSCLLAVISLEKNMTFETITYDPNVKELAHISFDPDIPVVQILRILVTILTILIIVGIILHYLIRFKYDKFRLVIPKNSTFLNYEYSFYMILEILLNAVHTPIGVDSDITLPQRIADKPVDVNIDVLLTILLLFFRSYHIMKFFAFHSKWNNVYNEDICNSCNVKFNFSFCIKSEFKECPFFLVSIILLISICIFGYSLRCSEMFFMYYASESTYNMNWKDFWNGLWCIIITMTTVGFGDFYPISILGRVIVVIACFWGTFLISMMVAALTFIVEFNSQEAISYEKIKCSNNEKEYGLQAVKLLQNCFRYFFLMKKLNNDCMLINNAKFRALKSTLFFKMKTSFEQFRKIKNIKEKQYFYFEIEKIMKRLNVKISKDMDTIKEEISIMPEIKKLMFDYHKNQENLKTKILELYKELEEICIFKDHFVKPL